LYLSSTVSACTAKFELFGCSASNTAVRAVSQLLLSIGYEKQKSKRSEPEDNQVLHLLLSFVRSQRRNVKMHRMIPTHATNNSYKTKDMSLKKKFAVKCVQFDSSHPVVFCNNVVIYSVNKHNAYW
jgi:hypothetical protein